MFACFGHGSKRRSQVLAQVMLSRQSRRRLRPLAATLPLVSVLLLSFAQVPLLNFIGVAPSTLARDAVARQAADKGFGSAKAPKKKKKSTEEGSESEETSIVKDKKSSKSKALSKQRLSDLRDKTLALRQKREEELDEYEMGKAMIAKYGREVAVMPQNVAERVAKRGMVVGGSFYATMIAVFGFGLGGSSPQSPGGSYGMMSASWDPDKEGSALGAEERLRLGHNHGDLGRG
eukprot:Skav216148  [mRNA]  locus=scaffold2590:135184:145374:- [translate_table: standard]